MALGVQIQEKNDKKVFVRPDLAFKKYKLAIFVDSEFFHEKIGVLRSTV
nr:very short patch repair endonuclease [Elizabethkingia anophelis]